MNNFKINTDFSDYCKIFFEQNAKLNLISKNDEKVLYEKHIYDSLAIKLFFEKYSIKNGTILDIGCGGGFPCVPIAIECTNFNVIGLDSIRKKINAVNEIKSKLNIHNLSLICSRAENITTQYDIVISRAVADMEKISGYALPLVKTGGYFIAYKSKKAIDELEKAKPIIKKYNSEIADIIPYTLPLEDIFERNLLIIRKRN